TLPCTASATTVATAAFAATAATLATAPTTAMASPTVLTFDAEGRAVDFDVWVDDLQLFLQCDSRDGVSLFDHTSGVSTAPAATADSTVRSQWTTRDAVARLAVRIADLVAHLRTSDARYRAALPTEDHFLSLCPTELTVDLLEERLTAAEKSILAVGASSGDRCTPFFEGCSPVPLLPFVASAAAVDLVGTEEVGAASAPSGRRRTSKGKGSKGGGGGGGGSSGVGGGGGGSGGGGGTVVAAVAEVVEAAAAVVEVAVSEVVEAVAPVVEVAVAVVLVKVQPRSVEALVAVAPAAAALPGEVCGLPHTTQRCFGRLTDAWRAQFPDPVELPRWHDLLLQNVVIFYLDFDAILAAMYAIDDSAEGDCYLSVPPDPGIAAAALGASASAAPGTGASALSRTTPTESLHTFTFESVLAHSSTVLPCPAAPSGLLSGLHLPSFSTNLVSGADLQDAWVAASGQVFAAASRSSPVSAPCSCRPLSHETLLWHHRLGHPSLPRLRGMASRALVSGLPRSLPPLPPGPAPTCVPCVEGRQRAAPHSSEFPLTEAPQQTLHMDVWGPARVRGQGHERYFLLVVDDYSNYTTVFPLRSKGEVSEVLIDWIRDRGGEFSSDLLRGFCCSEGIRQTFTLPASPQQNGIAEHRIGMVMDVARTSMIHASAPHFLAVRSSVCLTSRCRTTVSFPTALPLSPPPLLFLAPGTPPVDPLPPQGPAPSGVSQVDPAEPDKVAVDSGAARGAEPAGAGTRGAGTGGAELEGAEPGGAESGGAESGRMEPEGTTSGAAGGAGGAGGVASAGAAGAAGGAAGTGDPGAEGTGSVSAVSGGAAWPRPYYVPLLQQVLGSQPSPGPPPPFLSPPRVQSQSQLQPASPLPGPSPYSGPTRSLTERREPESRPVSPDSRPASPVRTVRACRVSRPRPPSVPGTHSMTLRPSTAPQRVPLPSPPASSLPAGPDPASDSLRAASSAATRFLATAVTDPLFESTVASALVAELVDFAAACRLDYAISLVAESASASVCPSSVGGECALGTDVLEDRQEEFECFAATVPHLVSILVASEGDPDAPDIPTPRSYAEAIEGPYSSQWQAAMDAEMASWKSTRTYVDEVPPPGANIVSGMWIFRTFSPTSKMTTLRVLLNVAAQRDYELHSLDFSTAFLQGSLHEEIWLRRPPGFTGSFPAGTQWILRRPVYGLRQAPREWHDTLMTTLAALGFAPSTSDPFLFLRTITTLPPFYVLVYVDDLVFATDDTEALANVKSELQKRHTCTDLGELTSYLGLRITRDRAQRTITLTQSHMVQQVLQRFGFTYSSPQSTPLPTSHSLSAPPSDESVEPSGPYPELVGCLMYLMTCTQPDLAYPLSFLARYVAPSRHRKVHWDAAKRVLRYLCSTLGMGLVLGGRARVVLTGYA
ncbi:unnamed protein product, partial [Closterium sp. NIES-53]